MKIYQGESRTVFCIGGFAIKVIHYYMFVWLIKNFVCKLLGQKSAVAISLNETRKIILRGVAANITEFAASVHCKEPALPRVYFTVGLVSVMKMIKGEQPTESELQRRFEQLPPVARNLQLRCSRHYFGPQNFRQVGQDIYIIDYGDILFDTQVPLSAFLALYHRDFSDVLCPSQPSE